MKARYFFRTLASALAIPLAISSCVDENLPSTAEDTSDEYVEVSLRCTGEITDQGETPLSRAGTDDLYYVQFLTMNYYDGTYYYDPFAYGLFDNVDNLKIKLDPKKTYRIEATMIEDAANVIYNMDGVYGLPFGCTLTNSFVYDNSFYSGNTWMGTADIVDFAGKYFTYNNPSVNRYYGFLEGYSPVDNQNINIEMGKMIFGIEVKTENLTEGQIYVDIEGAESFTVGHEEKSAFRTFSLFNLYNAYYTGCVLDKDVYEIKLVSIYLELTPNYLTTVAERPVAFYRNKKTTITVRIDTITDLEESGLIIDIDEPELTDDPDEEIFEYGN